MHAATLPGFHVYQNLKATPACAACLKIYRPGAMTDRETIESFKSGDDLAFVSIYNRYKSGIYCFCLKMLGDRDEALDALQDTFVRVFENRQRLLSTRAFRSWLYTIARNQCLNRIRRRDRQESTDTGRITAESRMDGPLARLEKRERIELVNRYLQSLKPSYREVIILREYHDLSYEEIGAVTRSTVSAVKSRLYKARRRLAAMMLPVISPDDGHAQPSLTKRIQVQANEPT